MRRKLIALSLLCSLLSIGCKNSGFPGDFAYNDKNVHIVDTLANVENKKAHIVFLYGQSNADGVSSSNYLKNKDQTTYDLYNQGWDNVCINFYNDGGNNTSNYAFKKCTLGCGCTPDYFGPEIGIAEIMQEAFSDEMTFIVKWTWGGTNLKEQWLDGKGGRGNLYNSSMDFSLKCLNYLKDKGYECTIDGICWMQGESDTLYENPNRYYKDTVSFVKFLRHDFKSYQENIKFIDAGINEELGIWNNPEKLNDSKKRFASESKFNIYIDPTELALTSCNEPEEAVDFAHFDSTSMVKLGRAFGMKAAGEIL